ncbi:hypothetical protein [Motiliproteus sp.]|uniref:hypothetical protein n=1 Tax=Motiliproteus sp. TaxID=1898955 RepID=UPI003BAAD2A3
MRSEEIVNARIEALHAGVSPAVRRSDGAQFAMMLSMISASQDWARQLSSEPASEADVPSRLDRNHLYTPELVGRMGQALQDERPGDLQMLVSWLDTVPLSGRYAATVAAEDSESSDQLPLSQAAVLAKGYDMVGEIQESSVQVAA